MSLRVYQRSAVRSVIDSIDSRPILVAPTGGGKTVMGVEVIRRLRAMYDSVKVLWLAHRKELIDQGAKHLQKHGEMVGIIMAGYPEMPLADIQVASRDTLIGRSKPKADIVVLDECHHAVSDTYREILDSYANSWLLGLTATPFRLDGSGLGDVFGRIVVSATARQLIEAGWLANPTVYAPKIPDLSGIKVLGGDYQLGSLSKSVNTREASADIIETWKLRAGGKRTVCFAVDVIHSKAITEAFTAAGIPAEHLDGKTPKPEREGMLARLAAGRTLVLSNCMVLTEGWDLPALECAILARPTASLNLHLQMIGRVLRAATGKDGAIVLDFAGNHHTHGPITRELEYSLDGTVRTAASEPLGLRRCNQCGLMFEANIDACPECGWVFEPGSSGERGEVPIHGSGELTEFSDEDFEYRRWFWNALEGERAIGGFKDGWSWFRFKERFGVEPLLGEIDGALVLVNPKNATREEKEAVYLRYLNFGLSRGFAEGWASHRYKEAFGVWPTGFVGRARRETGLRRFGERLRECGRT